MTQYNEDHSGEETVFAPTPNWEDDSTIIDVIEGAKDFWFELHSGEDLPETNDDTDSAINTALGLPPGGAVRPLCDEFADWNAKEIADAVKRGLDSWREGLTIKTAVLAVGKARTEDRAPSHDGEFVTIYWRGRGDEVIAENNGGTFCWDDFGLDLDGVDAAADEVEAKEEGGRLIASNGGTEADLSQCNSGVLTEMRELGWIK